MRLVSLIAASLLLLIGLAGLFVRFVPPEHIGKRGDARLGPGPQWTTPLHPIRIEAQGPQVFGLRGAHDAFVATDAQGHPIQVGAVLHGATVEQVKAGLAAGSTSIAGATIFMQARSKRADAAALSDSHRALRGQTIALMSQASKLQSDEDSKAQAVKDAQARAAAKEESARQRAQAANTAAIARIDAETRADIATIRTQNGAQSARLVADGALALAEAEARRDALRGQALAGPGGRYHLAIEAAKRFRFNADRLDAGHPEYFRSTWGLAAWRTYFLGEASALAPQSTP